MTEPGAKPASELGGSAAATENARYRRAAALVTGAISASGESDPGLISVVARPTTRRSC